VKLPAGRIDGFVAKPDPAVAVALLYGPDRGLAAERAARLAAQVVADPADPFVVTELAADRLTDEPRLLVEAAQALTLTGVRRLVRVRDATDPMTPAVRQLLATRDIAAFVLLEAGDLGGGSALRKVIEAADRAMALPCYRDEGETLREVIRDGLAAGGLHADAEVLGRLAELLGADRALTRQELHKLALYIGDRPDRRVSDADVDAVLDDSAALALSDVIDAALVGDATLEPRLLRLLAEGQRPEMVLRATAATLVLLLRLRLAVDAGTDPRTAIKGARPPIHFRREPALARAVARWSADAIAAAVERLRAAEAATRRGLPADLICRHELLRLADLPTPDSRRLARGGPGPIRG
jgi:DNA polymerase-3 subunit delta